MTRDAQLGPGEHGFSARLVAIINNISAKPR